MGFQFHRKNLITNVSQLWTSSNSSTLANIFDRRATTKWQSSGENTDGNTATISWVPGSSTIVESILVKGCNWEAFNIIYNSSTSNQFNPALSVTTFANENLLYIFGSQAINSIDFNIWNTQIANTEKSVSEIIITHKKIELDVNPTHQGYRPTKYKKGIEHEMSDGGIVSVFLSKKFRANISLDFISSQTYSSLTGIYDEHSEFVFVPFPVNTYTSAWNGECYTVNWTGDLQIDQFKNNNMSGYIGNINLAETPL